MLFSLLAIHYVWALLGTLVLAFPTDHLYKRDYTPDPEVHPNDPTTLESFAGRINRLDATFPGIFWVKAYPGEAGKCTFEQLNILEEATRTAVRLTNYSPPDTDDAAFQRYFVTDGRVSGGWTNGPNRARYMDLINNLKQVSQFPSIGDSKKRLDQRWRVGYLCTKVDGESDRCANKGVQAYTVQGPTPGKSEDGTVIIFCPAFFEHAFTNLIAAGPRKTKEDLGDPNLVSFEQILMHEWMHCDRMGFRVHITDIEYGSSRCHDLAWKNIGRGQSDPNPDVVINADSYAWMWMNREFGKVWNWSDDQGTSLTIDDPNYGPAQIDPDPIPIKSPTTQPANCIWWGNSFDCVYIGSTYDEYLLDVGKACTCDEDGCSEDSPSCCANGSCGSCNCSGSGCGQNSPSCCVSGTCLWSS